MAFSTKRNFWRIGFHNEAPADIPNPISRFQSYVTCHDARAWSQDVAQRAQYLFDIIHEDSVAGEDGRAGGDASRREDQGVRNPDGTYQVTGQTNADGTPMTTGRTTVGGTPIPVRTTIGGTPIPDEYDDDNTLERRFTPGGTPRPPQLERPTTPGRTPKTIVRDPHLEQRSKPELLALIDDLYRQIEVSNGLISLV